MGPMDVCISDKENTIRNNQQLHEKEQLNYTPHFATLTETGQANFSRLSDAIAEFLDNALSACSMNAGNRTIYVSVCLNDDNINEITIRDNGQGMTREGIHAFATYFLTQAERDQTPSEMQLTESKPGQFLGKYGVGAMQAGFFIGSRIELHTKSSSDSHVLQFSMDERIYRERQSRGDEVYCDPLIVRLPGDYVYSDGGGRSSHRERLLAEEKVMPQFTCITLRLRTRFVRELHKAGFVQRLINELGHIYHYHLHDEDWPANVECSGRYSKRKKGKRQKSTVDKALFSTTASLELEVRVEVWKQGIKTLNANLNKVDTDLESRRVGVNGMAKDMFSFTFEVRNPSEKGPEWLNCTGACYYFPTVSGRETRPVEEKEATDDEYVAENDMFDPEFEVFWQKRLVPQSYVRRLPFFPSVYPSREDRDALGPWQQRIGTVLHFPYHCPTSNNKLKILLGPDLTDYLCHKETALFSGKKLASEFKSWLARCNSLYNDIATFSNSLEQHSKRAGISIWGKCSFGASGHAFCTGDKVKLITNPAVFGSIIRFETEGVDALGRATHSGARIVVCRCPEEIFGLSDEQSHPITRIDPLESVVLENLWEEYMEKTCSLLPASLRIFSYKAGGRPVGKEVIFSCEDWAIWSPFQVQIMDGSKPPKVITKFPVTKEPLSVYMEVREGSMDTGKSIAFVKLDNFDLSKNHSLLFKKIKALSVPGSYNARFWVSPKGGLEKRVLVHVLPAEPASLEVVWTDEKQQPFFVNLFQSSKAEEETGTPLPAFEITLQDSKGNECPVDFLKSIALNCSTEAESELLRVTLRNRDSSDNISSSNCSEMCLENSGTQSLVGQEFSDEQWVLHPLCQGILAKLRGESKCAGTSNDDDELLPVRLGIEFTAILKSGVTLMTTKHVLIGPGAPSGIICISDECMSLPCTAPSFPRVCVEDGCTLPPMLMKLVDINDNPTVPGRTEAYIVKVFSDEPDRVVFGSSTSTTPYCTSIEVRSNGEAELKGIVASSVLCDESSNTSTVTMPHETTVLIQLFQQYLRKAKCRKSSSSSTVDGGSFVPEKHVGEVMKLRVTLLPDQPIGLSVPSECLPKGTIEVGSIVKGLEVKFIGCDREECPTHDRIHAVVKEMSVSWNSFWRWTPADIATSALASEDNNLLLVSLPNLEVPTRLEKADDSSSNNNHKRSQFQISVLTMKGKNIVCELPVKVVAGPAIAWGNPTSSGTHEGGGSPVITLGGGRDIGSMIGQITAVDKYGNPSVYDLRHEPHNLKIELDFSSSSFSRNQVDNDGVMADKNKQGCGSENIRPHLCPPCPLLEKMGTTFDYVLSDGVVAFRGKGHSLEGHIVVSPVENEGDLKPFRLPAIFSGGPLASLSVKAPSVGIQEWSVGDNLNGNIHVNVDIVDFAIRGLDELGDTCTPDADGHRISLIVRDENDGGGEISCSSLALDENGEGMAEAFNVGLGVHCETRVVFVEVRLDGGCKPNNVKPVVLCCNLLRSNYVTSLHVAAVRDDFVNVDQCIADFRRGDVSFKQLHAEGISIGNVGASVTCDGPLPNLAVWCEMEDAQPFIPTLDSLQFKLQLQHGDESYRAIAFEDAYCCEDSSKTSKMALLLKARAGFEPAFVGCMIIECFYTENRASIVERLKKSGRSTVMNIEDDLELMVQVLPGALASLSPHSGSMSKLQNLTCGNRGGDDEEALPERSLVPGPIYFIGNDAYGNETSVPGPILATITGAGNTTPPRLEGSDLSGYLFSEECNAQSLSSSSVEQKKHKHRKNKRSRSARHSHVSLSSTKQNIVYHSFPTLRVEAGSGERPGCYELVFQCQDSESTEVQPWITQIQFADDSKRIEHLHALQEQLQSLEELLDRALEAEAEAMTCGEEARQDLDNYIESNEGHLPHLDTLKITDLSDLASSRELMEDIAEEARNTRRELQEMSSTYSPRPPVHAPKMEYEANALKLKGCLGHVVKLGFVPDNHLARLLSWTVQNRLKAVLLESKEEQSRAARGGLATYSMDTIRPFQLKRRDRRASSGFTTIARSKENIEAQSIPLPPVDTEGFIGYAVNLIILPRESEHLRDTLFWALYGNLCVFETLEQMSNHAQQLKSRNKAAMSMVSLDGYKRDTTGFIDGNKNAILEPGKALSYVYGSPPDLPECTVMKQRLESLEELLSQLERVVSSNEGVIHATDKIFANGESIASLQQDVDSLRKDIALVASGEEKADSAGQQHVEKSAVAKKNTATADVQKSTIGKKRVKPPPHKNRSGKRVSR